MLLPKQLSQTRFARSAMSRRGSRSLWAESAARLKTLAKKEKAPRALPGGLQKIRRRPTLPPGCPGSTIGAVRLNFRVRNGNGCDPAPMTTGKLAAARGRRKLSKIKSGGGTYARRHHCGLSRRSAPAPQYVSARAASKAALAGQLNTLQTVVSLSPPHACFRVGTFVSAGECRRKNKSMVKPHGGLVSVSFTSRDVSTSDLSTWSSSRSL